MSLYILIGSSGSGKTDYLYRTITDMAEKGGRYFAVVPEQYTMETQKKIVSMTSGKGTMNIDIVSFNRLADRIFEETGTSTAQLLDDTGKCMVLRKVMDMRKDELKVFKSKISYPGFIDEVQSLISEFYQYGIGEKEMQDIIDKAEKRPLLKGKMEDIMIIATEFKKYLEGKFMIPEEMMSKLCGAIPKSEIIRESIITFDGFTGFTALQYNVIENLLKYGRDVVITITMQKNPSNEDLFSLSSKTIKKLECIAENQEKKVIKKYMEGDCPFRYKDNEPIAWMEKNLFSYGKKVYDGNNDSIKIYEAANPTQECEFVAARINELVRNENLRYKDIAVISGDIEAYYHGVKEAFTHYNVPCFIDYKRQINNNPFIESIKALLETVDNNYAYESMFRFLRCGMADMENDEVDRLENYVIEHGIGSYKRWNMEWNDADEDILALRDELLSRINVVYKGLKNRKADVREYTKVLYEYIENENMQAGLKEYEEMFENAGEPVLAKEYSQVYKKVMELFDKVVMLLGDEKIKLKEYIGILEAGFQEIKVGVIPPTLDRVVVGDMERTRLGDIKVLFFIGVNDGIVPKTSGSGGVLSEIDRNFLEECDVELAPTKRENSFIQKFYLYLNITKMSDKLIVSYSRCSSAGKTLRPSYFISTLLSGFKGMKVEVVNTGNNMMENISTEKNMETVIADGLREYAAGTGTLSDEWKEVYSLFDDNDKKELMLSAAFYNDSVDNVDRAVANALYGKNLRGSVSRLETFASCAYRHFLMYGLNIVDRKRYEVSQIDIGNFYHSALEKFSNKMREHRLDWRDVSDSKRRDIVQEAVAEVSGAYEDKAFYGTARDRYLIDRMNRMLDRTTWALCNQLSKGKFVPEGYEVRFDGERSAQTLRYQLSEDEKMNLRGTIDRIDIYETDDDIYIKIIDYKSGNKKFDISDVYNGLQLQLVLYMEAASDMIKRNAGEKNVIPAGIFYYDIKNPVIDESDSSDWQYNLLKEMRPSGMLNDRKEVISAMDEELKEGVAGTSEVIPVSFTGKGIRKGSGVLDDEKFDTLITYVHKKAGKLGKNISEGCIEKNPYKKHDGKNPCEYCEYKPVCRFDIGLEGNKYRNLPKLDDGEIWEMMKEADDENEMD